MISLGRCNFKDLKSFLCIYSPQIFALFKAFCCLNWCCIIVSSKRFEIYQGGKDMVISGKQVKELARNHQIDLWRIAEAFGVTPSYFSTLLRHSFNEEDSAKLKQIIETLANDRR